MDLETAEKSVSSPSQATLRLGFIGTSVLASAVGVVVAALFDHIGLAVAGWIAGSEPVLYHNEVVFNGSGSDLVLAGGVVACLVAGSFFLTLYPGSRRYDGARITILWLVLHCFREGFSQLALITLSPDSNIAVAFSSLDVPAGFDLIVAAAGLVGLISVALASAPAFLAYAHRQREISTPTKRFSFATKLAFAPGVGGSLLAVPFFLPDRGVGLVETLPLMGLFTIATVLAALGTRTVTIGDYRERRGFDWTPLVWYVVLLLIFRLALVRGLLIPPSMEAFFENPL